MESQQIGIALLAVIVVLLFLAEQRFPLRQPNRPLGERIWINLIFSALAYGMAAALIRPSIHWAMNWSANRSFGLLHFLEFPPLFEVIIAFLLLDVTFYYWHIANHRIPFLWRFHNVHHIDPDLDVTTSLRFHFVEVALSVGLRVAQVVLIGVSFGSFVAYETVFQAGTFFHHSNLRLPLRLERLLNFIVVTPRMHGIHHSQIMEETNSNYSVVFSWWDRIHRTLRLNISQSEINIGVPAYSSPEDNRLWKALTAPFHKQKQYWPPSFRISRHDLDEKSRVIE